MKNMLHSIRAYFTRTDTYSYRGWLVSDRFSKRLVAFAGYGAFSYIGIEIVRIVVIQPLWYILFIL
jgi:hypothetical protein